jgi:hypothetical protein
VHLLAGRAAGHEDELPGHAFDYEVVDGNVGDGIVDREVRGVRGLHRHRADELLTPAATVGVEFA